MSAPLCHMIVWASGMIDFITDPQTDPEQHGAILVCTARGKDDIYALLQAVRETSVLTDFSGRMALRVPNIDPAEVVSDIHQLIYWADDLRDQLFAYHPAIAWVRQ